MFKAEILKGRRKNEWLDIFTKEDVLNHDFVGDEIRDIIKNLFDDSALFFIDKDKTNGKLMTIEESFFRKLTDEELRLGKRIEKGMKLIVKKDLETNKIYGEESFVCFMEKFKGKEVTVKETICHKDTHTKYVVEETEYVFTPEMIERIKDYDNVTSFKVGDKVVLKKDLDIFKKYGSEFFVPSMEKLKEIELTIKEIDTPEKGSRYAIEESEFFITDEMIDKKVESVKIKKTLKEGNIIEIGDGRKLILIDKDFKEKAQIGRGSCVVSIDDYNNELKPITLFSELVDKYLIKKISYTSVSDGLKYLHGNKDIEWDWERK